MTTQFPDADKILSAFGLNPQAFPIYYGMGPATFLDAAGAQSGLRGSVARLSKSLSNPPHLFMGLRIWNTINPPDTDDDGDWLRYEAAMKYQGGEQYVRMSLAQQNILADGILQTTLCGVDGIHWHPFPAPFPMQGGNDIELEIVRATSYGTYSDATPIVPTVNATLLCAVLRNDMKTQPMIRRVP